MDAVDDLRDSIDATRNFLTPVRAGVWLRLAIVALFVGGFGTGAPSIPSGDVGPAEERAPDVSPGEIPEEALAAVAVALGLLFLLWLLFAFISAVMEFVFIESLRSTEVRVRRYANENVGRGIRLFGFRVFVVLAGIAIVGTPVAALLLGLGGLEATSGTFIAVALFAIPVYLVYAIVNRFTSEFVAPIMLLENRGVLGAWSRFWSTFRSNSTEYVVYLLLVWIVQAAVGLAVSILVLIGGIVVAIPFALLAFAFFLLGDIGAIFAAIVAVVGIVTFVLFALLVQVPIVSYFKYYALLLLGDTDAELDLIPDQRAAIRTDGGEGPTDVDGTEPAAPADRWESGESEGSDDRDATSDDDWQADYGWTDEDEMDDWDDRADRSDREDRSEDEDRDDEDRGW
ncbi:MULTISPECIES: DUF7544 domain-containing protein [Natrialbaceae]|uniref:DUF7544 domain-containing protein n=1 Tax=Natrialbaceae TaxID=1644061 RepID=UPI00207D1255|nr:hypothetical protein [Natronococcus sp. CG52]